MRTCQRCGAEAHYSSAAGYFCEACQELDDIEQHSMQVEEENAALRTLLKRGYTLLDAISQPFQKVELFYVKEWLKDAERFIENGTR